jgi:tetratricopeptide (TPR) repeat protein
MDFSGGMAALNGWLDAMERKVPPSESKPFREGSLDKLEKANSEINKADPRSVIFGLMELESLWRNVGPEPKILRSAVKGYAMLLMVLHPDRMDDTDSLAGYGLSFLALAKRLDPKFPLAREEALLAMNMGYTAHATSLIQSSLEGSSDPANGMLDAYIREDLQTLKTLQEKNPGVLSYYLLARLYRNIGLDREAQEVSTEFFEKFPVLYPAIVETIYSGDLGLAKALTVLYPLDILARLEHVVSPLSFLDRKAWLARIKGFIGEPSNISITRFETLLHQWHPLEKENEKGFIVDESRVKTIFKTLYAGALFLRFKMLKDRWAVVDMAQNYAQSLTAEDKDHPLAMEMLAEVYREIGKHKEADALCAKVINHAHTSGKLAGAAHYYVEDMVNQIGLTTPAIQKMDGRPEYHFHRGIIFKRIRHYDLAEKCYSLGLVQNPYWYRGYRYLAQVTGGETPLSSALTKFPYSFMLMKEAGDYFADKEDPSSKEKAANYYEMALKLVPTHESLALKKAMVLRRSCSNVERLDSEIR